MENENNLAFGYQLDKDQEKKTSQRIARRGTKIVITGSIASILLWFLVSILGKPVTAVGNFSPLYLSAIAAPAVLIAVLAIHKSKSRQNY
jgi:hypothetical protein